MVAVRQAQITRKRIISRVFLYRMILDPLRDLGGFKLAYLRDHGYQGDDLLAIYTAAKASGKEVLV